MTFSELQLHQLCNGNEGHWLRRNPGAATREWPQAPSQFSVSTQPYTAKNSSHNPFPAVCGPANITCLAHSCQSVTESATNTCCQGHLSLEKDARRKCSKKQCSLTSVRKLSGHLVLGTSGTSEWQYLCSTFFIQGATERRNEEL